MKKIFLTMLLFVSITSKAQKISDTPKIVLSMFPTIDTNMVMTVAYEYLNCQKIFQEPVRICIKVCDSAMLTPCELYSSDFDFDTMPPRFKANLFGITPSAYGRLYVECLILDKKKNVLLQSERQKVILYTRDEWIALTDTLNRK